MSAEELGPRLRRARERSRLSLRALARDVGVTASMLSQIEVGKALPSVSTLYALATRLGVSFDDLLGIQAGGLPDGPGPTIFRHREDNTVLEMSNGVRWEMLAGSGRLGVDFLLVTYAPGSASSTERQAMTHSGTESALIVSGSLTLVLDAQKHLLTAGDSFSFDSTLPHLYLNESTEPASGVWTVVGRSPTSPAEPAPAQPGSAVDVLRALDALR